MSDHAVEFINVMEVKPDRSQELITLLVEGTEEVIRHRPGFVSSRVLVSTDGSCVVNHVLWRQLEDLQATRGDPRVGKVAARIAAIARPRPIVCSPVPGQPRSDTTSHGFDP